MCVCGEELALHNPCSVCQCPVFIEKGPGKKAKKFPKRPTK